MFDSCAAIRTKAKFVVVDRFYLFSFYQLSISG